MSWRRLTFRPIGIRIVYRNILLTLLLIVAIIIAIELGRPRPAPMPLDNRAEQHFAAARAVLEKRIPELNLHDVTVRQALDTLHHKTGVPIEANWISLEELRDRKVDIELHNVALGDAVLFLLGLDRYNVTFYPTKQAEFDIVNGTLVIGSDAAANGVHTFPKGVMTLRSYDVRDLLTDQFWGYQSTGSTSIRGKERLDSLANLVQAEAGLKNYEWMSDNPYFPTGQAEIFTFAGRLFVVQTAYGHIQVESFLRRLRAADHQTFMQ